MVDKESVRYRCEANLRDIASVEARRLSLHGELTKLQTSIREARTTLDSLTASISIARPVADDMASLENAERLAVSDSAASQALVDIVRERRMQRREARGEGTAPKQASRKPSGGHRDRYIVQTAGVLVEDEGYDI